MSVFYCSKCDNIFTCNDNKEVKCPKCAQISLLADINTLSDKKDSIYINAVHKKKIALCEDDFKEAGEIFAWLGKFRDCPEQVKSCEYLAHLQAERDKAEAMSHNFTPQKLKTTFKGVIIAVSVITLLITVILLSVSPIKYAIAKKNFENEELEKAAEIYAELGNYKDSKKELEAIYKILSDKAGKHISCSALEPWFEINVGGTIDFKATKYEGNGNITVPDIFNGIEVVAIEESCFKNSKNLISVTLPQSLREIREYAFYGCSSLSEIAVPDKVILIAEYAFKDCSSLSKINIPKGITNISSFVFSGCEKLDSVILPTGITKIEASAFMGCVSLKEIVISYNVKTIEDFAFSSCTALEKIILPSSLTKIGKNAFYQCNSLIDITYMGSSSEFKNINIEEGNDIIINTIK